MNLDCNSNTNVGIKINSKFDGKSSNSSTAVDVKFSSRILRFHTVNKDSGSPVANIESSSVAGSSLKRQNTDNIYSQFLELTLEVTVLKVIGIFLRQSITINS